MNRTRCRITALVLTFVFLATTLFLWWRGMVDLCSIIVSLATGFTVWALTVYWPDRIRRKDSLALVRRKYHELRKALIRLVIQAIDRRFVGLEEADKLSDFKSFRCYLREKYSLSRAGDLLANGLDADSSILNDVDVEFEGFTHVMETYVCNCDVLDGKAETKAEELVSNIIGIKKYSCFQEDRSKYVSRFVLELLTCCTNEGDAAVDCIEQMLGGGVKC